MNCTESLDEEQFASAIKKILSALKNSANNSGPLDDKILLIRSQCQEIAEFLNCFNCYKPDHSWKSTATVLFGLSAFELIIEWIYDAKSELVSVKKQLVHDQLFGDCFGSLLLLMIQVDEPSITQSVLKCIECIVFQTSPNLRLEILNVVFDCETLPSRINCSKPTWFGILKYRWIVLNHLLEKISCCDEKLSDAVLETLKKHILVVCRTIDLHSNLLKSSTDDFSDLLQFLHLMVGIDREDLIESYLPSIDNYLSADFSHKIRSLKCRSSYISLLRKITAVRENGLAFMPSLTICRHAIQNFKDELQLLHNLSDSILESCFVGTVSTESSSQLHDHRETESYDMSCFNTVEVMDLVLVLTQAIWTFCSLKGDVRDFEEIRCSISFANDAILSVLLRTNDYPLGHLVTLLSGQDDALISFLIMHLNICCTLKNLQMNDETLPILFASPNELFIRFASSILFDSSVLLDWLTSNETEFLLFLIKYSKFILKYPNDFEKTCKTLQGTSDGFQNCLQGFKSMIESLSCSIEKLTSKDLFPYHVSPLMRNIQRVLTVVNTFEK